MFDTHSHIQFKIFDENRDEVIQRARLAGISKIIAVGTNVALSKKAVEVSETYSEVFAAVGIHPHHVFAHLDNHSVVRQGRTAESILRQELDDIESLISHPKVIAVGETGMDKHHYPNTKYEHYKISSEFLQMQAYFYIKQIELAIKHKKTLIVHNRDAGKEALEILSLNWNPILQNRTVFHCCEPDKRLLEFAKTKNCFIGIDGDITYNPEKQEFLRSIPLENLVLETDSPFFIPEPLKSKSLKTNEPANLKYVSDFLSKFLKVSQTELSKSLESNSQKLFNLAV